MFVDEAKWIGTQISELTFQRRPIRCLNLGSSTGYYREISQPHINQYIFDPLRALGKVTHMDIKEADGVDVACDFMDESSWSAVPVRAYDLVVCSNLLTHVADQIKVFKLIKRSVTPGGYILISAPHLYPYCADPFDAKYRPSQDDIVHCFEGYSFVRGAKISINESHFTRLRRDPRAVASLVANLLLPINGFARWQAIASDLPNLLKPLTTVCLILQAPSAI